MFAITVAFAQSTGGYIDRDSVIRVLPEYKLEIADLDNKAKGLRDTFEIYFKAYKKLEHRCSNVPNEILKDTLLFRKFKLVCKTELDSAQKFISDYSKYSQNSFAFLQQNWDEIIKKRLESEYISFCKKKKISLLFDKKAMLYCPNCMDYTNELIKYISH